MKSQTSIVVKKFGGTSLGSIERIEMVADRIVDDAEKGQRPLIVASAMAGETNRLINLATQVFPNNRGEAYDMLLASGEQVSVALLALALQKRGVEAKPFVASQVGIETDRLFSKAHIEKIHIERLKAEINNGSIPVIAGFQGMTADHQITTLGRGGSDTTAVAISAALGLSDCEIYTDVPGVFTADPNIVPNARKISRLAASEMLEMASLGSKVVYTRSMEIAYKYRIRTHVRSTFELRDGTWIVPEGEIMEKAVVNSVVHDGNVALFKINSIPDTKTISDCLSQLAQKGIVVDMLQQNIGNGHGHEVQFTVGADDSHQTQSILSEFVAKPSLVETKNDLSKVSIVGLGMRNHPWVGAQFFKVFSTEKIPVLMLSNLEIRITALIQKKDQSKAVQALHKAFSLEKNRDA